MKFKKGDKVRIIAKGHGHGFEIGEEVIITKVDQRYKIYCSAGVKKSWWIADDVIEAV